MQISILKGVFTGSSANFRTSYPVNMEPVIGENGISGGYLRTAPGVTQLAVGPGADRGSIIWNGVHYRVMGSKLVRYDGAVVPLGDVGNDGKPVSFDYGFDRLAICSNGGLYYWNGAALSQVVDPNLGVPLDVCFIDGYYMTTDGIYLVVTELANPMVINPLKYGSSEADPDPLVAVMRVRDEVYAVNTNTIENFQNVGGTGFPFQRNPGGLIPKGACGTGAVCAFLDTLGFVGNGRGEALSVYIAGYGAANSISTPEIDRQLGLLSLAARAAIEIEAVEMLAEQRLYVHLPTMTMVYHHQASLAAQQPVWSYLIGGANLDQVYPARHFAYSGYGWIGGSAAGLLGTLDESAEQQFGVATTCRFDTVLLYNASKGGILKSAELVGTPGRAPVGVAAQAFMSWSQDGRTWSQERAISIGASGQYLRRMQWRPKTRFANYMSLRFRLPAAAVISFARLEVDIEPLNA